MTPAEFRAIRKQLGLSTVQMGRALGYEGSDNSVSVTIRRYEAGIRPIPPTVAMLVAMYERHGLSVAPPRAAT
jgi:transcriptional regulator with XRE-family HTH domain